MIPPPAGNVFSGCDVRVGQIKYQALRGVSTLGLFSILQLMRCPRNACHAPVILLLPMLAPIVLFVITRSDAIGGAHIHVRDMATALRRQGIDARVAVGGDGPYLAQLRQREIPIINLQYLVRPVRPTSDMKACRELVQLLRTLRPTLVSAHSSKAGLLVRIACRRAGVPVVFTAHGWAFTDGVGKLTAAIYRQAERFAGALADRIITVSEFDRRIALVAGVGGEKRLRAIHNGMPFLPCSAEPKDTTVPLRMVMTARLDEQKDHRTLLLALAQLLDLSWQLDLIGEGPLLPTLQALAAELKIAERVRFLGLRNDVGELLRNADIFVLISHWEGFPRSILEGMRAGLPVVATDVAGVAESVAEGSTGHLVPRDDPTVLTARLRSLLTDPQQRAAMGAAGRARFEAEFTFDRMFRGTLAVYDEVMQARNLHTRFLPFADSEPSA